MPEYIHIDKSHIVKVHTDVRTHTNTRDTLTDTKERLITRSVLSISSIKDTQHLTNKKKQIFD